MASGPSVRRSRGGRRATGRASMRCWSSFGRSSSRIVTGCWGLLSRPRTRCRRRCCARGGVLSGLTKRRGGCVPGCTRSPPMSALTCCAARRGERSQWIWARRRSGVATWRAVARGAWVLPIPDRLALTPGTDPADLAEQRETIRLAFVVALQRLPPRRRAVVILRDVLAWRADEVARLLGSSVASVNSALQRARSTLTATARSRPEAPGAMDTAQQALLARYCDAFERYDVDALVSLLHEDASMSMPPFAWWLRGRSDIRRALLAAGRPCEGAVLRPTMANGSRAFGQYRPTGVAQAYEPFALVTIELRDGLIGATTTHLDARRLFPLFGLPTDGTSPV